MYKLKSDKDGSRIYLNDRTGSECRLDLILTDQQGEKWYGFHDLFQIPIIRSKMASKIVTLFGVGFTLEDLQAYSKKGRELCRSADGEKYEKIYSMFLEMESLANNTADPIKQQMNLAAVYILREGERLDWFDEQDAAKKVNEWMRDLDTASFFLSWLERGISSLTNRLNSLSQIASIAQGMKK